MMPLMGSLERILLGNPLGGSYTGGEKSMWEQGIIYVGNGKDADNEMSVRTTFLPCRGNVYYTQRTIPTSLNVIWRYYFYDNEKRYLGYHDKGNAYTLQLTPESCAFLRISLQTRDNTPLHPTDVPNITIEDRSIWGWRDVDPYNAIYSTKTVTTQIDHFYYQSNQNNYILHFQGGGGLMPDVVSKLSVVQNNQLLYINITDHPTATPTNIGDLVFEDRDVWGWYIYAVRYMSSQVYPIEKRLVTVDYEGDLRNPRIGFYGVNDAITTIVPITDYVIDSKYKTYRLFFEIWDNPNITPADMVNHGTWTVTFSDPVSEVWQSDGSVYYTPHNSEIQKGKILTITPPSSFKAVSLVVQDSTGQNSHDITGGTEVTLSDSTEWVYLTVGIAENPDVNLTNIDSFREQWSYSYKDIPVPAEPHWDGENFVFTAADIKEGKAYQKSGNDIVLVDDASSIALPIIPNVSASWTILIDNSSDSPLNGVEIRKTASGVTVGDGRINANSGRSVILQDAAGQVAFHFTKATLTAESLYNAIKIHGR